VAADAIVAMKCFMTCVVAMRSFAGGIPAAAQLLRSSSIWSAVLLLLMTDNRSGFSEASCGGSVDHTIVPGRYDLSPTTHGYGEKCKVFRNIWFPV